MVTGMVPPPALQPRGGLMDCDAAGEAKELVRHHLVEYIDGLDLHSSDLGVQALEAHSGFAVTAFARTLLKALKDSTAD